MKPRTKLHHRVVSLSETLPKITELQKQWAYKECLQHRGYMTKNRVLCLDCGETFQTQLVSRKRATCPHCSTKMTVKESLCTTDTQVTYFAIADVVHEFQVIRNFELRATYKKGRPAKHFLYEVLQYWVNPDLKYTMYGMNHALNYHCDSWNGYMEIRQQPKSYYGHNKYEIYPSKYHPDSLFKDEYTKLGINYKLQGLTFIEAAKMLPKSPQLETLLKAKQYELLRLGNSHKLETYWNSFKICLRNKYYPKDYSIYVDYLELLRYFNKDLRNAKYVCPKNLKDEHDKLVIKKREHQKKLDLQMQRERAEEADKHYQAEKSIFFDLIFTKGELIIEPLKSVHEFITEGDELKHCLFVNEYYSKPDSLILSARIENKPIETIEVSLSKMKIIQARGFRNNPTEHHKKIVSLVNKNLHRIKAVATEKIAV